MVGVVTRNEPELSWSEFDRAFYECKSVSGRASDPVADGINTLSCFADNAAAREQPSVLARSADGEPATRERPYFDWSHICPTHDAYREGLLEMIADAGQASGDVRLDDVGFPRAEYCHCDRCEDAFASSQYDEWGAWRRSVITEFLTSARERVSGDLFLTVHPDPYPGHIAARSGIDLDGIESIVDEFVVPLYDTHYGTTYWLESLASGFADRLESPFSVELYAVDVDVDDLIRATTVAETYADDVLYGYDASTARAAIRRRRADEHDGVSHRPDES
ncbi:MAG: hypothetical protein ABEI57_03485 [Halapricum sp.]